MRWNTQATTATQTTNMCTQENKRYNGCKILSRSSLLVTKSDVFLRQLFGNPIPGITHLLTSNQLLPINSLHYPVMYSQLDVILAQKLKNCLFSLTESWIFISCILLKNSSNKNDLLTNLSKQNVFFIVSLKMTSNNSNVYQKSISTLR